MRDRESGGRTESGPLYRISPELNKKPVGVGVMWVWLRPVENCSGLKEIRAQLSVSSEGSRSTSVTRISAGLQKSGSLTTVWCLNLRVSPCHKHGKHVLFLSPDDTGVKLLLPEPPDSHLTPDY